MTTQANLQKAVNLLNNVRVPASVTRELRTREIVDTEARMQVVCMPIAEFMAWVSKVGPIQVQRNDAYRLKNNLAKHLSDFYLPQGMFAVVFLEGKFYLVDGNTRKRAWMTCKGLKLPSHVFVTVMVPESREESQVFYKCYDSKASKKTVRDEITSLLASAGVQTSELVSKLVAGGKLVTVVQSMARAYYVKSNETTRKQIVEDYATEIVKLDTLGFDEGDVPMGAVWAALTLYKEYPEAPNFVTDYLNELAKDGTDSAGLMTDAVRDIPARARRACEAAFVGTSGAKACPVMYPVFLAGFGTYLAAVTKAKGFSKAYMNALRSKAKAVLESEHI